MVEVRNITKKYGSHTAVDNISFTLEPGRVYGLLGPNGAGKSTTMNIMTGYIAPSGGEVSVDGYDIYEDARLAKQQIGYLPENPPLYQDMTVHEYLMFVAELKGVKRKERYLAVESAMEDAGILDVADQLIRTLSKGYRQRVGFAGAVVNDPEVIILDEPTVGLDPKQIIEFRELIRELGEEHIVLISSHILSEISEVCDHVFIISGGRLIVDDAVENLGQYANEAVRIHITIKGDIEEAKKALSGIAGIRQLDVEGESELIAEVDPNREDMTETISMALMEEKILILGMTEEKGSLEQIFLDVTEKDELFEAEGEPLDSSDELLESPSVSSEDPQAEVTEDSNVPEDPQAEVTEDSDAPEDPQTKATEESEDSAGDPREAEPAEDDAGTVEEPEVPQEASQKVSLSKEDGTQDAVKDSDNSDDVGGMLEALFDAERKEEEANDSDR
ncbi:MAG: ATP-binding cassette domain-containing protein [Lachnospiraceae bacterium]|nr:ATP-binding cassette domain-containing protein [Lachnospiraceae bacterium]